MVDSLQGKTILIVDDDADIITAITTSLADTEATLETASDGNSAVEMAEEKKPDLVTRILASTEAHKTSQQWTKNRGQYIPKPSNFLKDREFEDDVTPEPGIGDPGSSAARWTAPKSEPATQPTLTGAKALDEVEKL